MDDAPSSRRDAFRRLVVVGKNSALWSRISERVLAQRPDSLAVGHGDLDGLKLTSEDLVWIFSYAPSEEANRQLFEKIASLGSGGQVYLSTATANMADRTTCYRYPRVKAQSERDARRILGARVVRIGLIHDDPAELPAGTAAATRLADLIAAMIDLRLAEDGGREPINLHQLIDRPFSGPIESAVYHGYGRLLRLAGSWPCLLRPLDLLLRSVGWRWYGYFRLSNEQCRTTI